MNYLDYEFMLNDRIAKIKSVNFQLDLENNFYLSFSGGKDSLIVHHLLDMALPNNQIPRVYVNTGIEYNMMLKYVRNLQLNDKRIIIVNSNKNIPRMLRTKGFPFKSKEFSLLNYTFYNMKAKGLNVCEKYQKRIRGDKDVYQPVPVKLRYLFNERPFIISDKCCYELKEKVLDKWGRDNNRTNTITGIRKAEGGRRSNTKGCITGNGSKFHPILIVSDEFEEEFIKRNNIELCELYYEPYNFKRVGCKGCPFNKDLQKLLDNLAKVLPNEYKQCFHLWKPVYDEYMKIGYRLKEGEEEC